MKDREFINPFTDFGFKRIFGQEISKEILIDFLNLLLNGEQSIVSLSFKNPELQPDIKASRTRSCNRISKTNDGSCSTYIAKAITGRSLL